jgi:REP element-mobilizing transposase RayT
VAKRKRGQQGFGFPNGWGGARRNAGAKPKGEKPGVSHRTRAPLASRFPVRITMKLRPGVPSLRHGRAHAVVLQAFAAMRELEDFRLVQYSVQSNHLHLICEALDRRELIRGVQSLAIRIAKRLNALWRRAGKLFADRYHDRILRTPREVRNALAYVLHNARKHGVLADHAGPDPCSSGRWFDGWVNWNSADSRDSPVARAKTWLLSIGWLQHGRLEHSAAAPKPST